MNPLAKRLSRVESELLKLQEDARRISATVEDLKLDLAPEEIALAETPSEAVPIPSSSKTVPPPRREEEMVQPKPVLQKPSASIIPPVDSAGIEMHLGRVWSVRLGILLLTTGFVLLSRYTYDNIIRDLGPGIRLTMMYFFSFALAGVGLFCERSKESLRSYGRIVAAGGLAAIYYCGFAAHNVEALRVIESPVLASIVMSLGAGLFCAISLWKKSRVMLSTSLALAFYSISINPIGWMACLSGVVLAAFGVGMMIRHRWVEVGFLVLTGSYASFTWWQFAINQGDSSISRWFLVCYWVLFATASLLARKGMNADSHLGFSSFNNTAFFLLFSFQIETGQWMENHWLFCFVFGATLMVIAGLSRNLFPERSRMVHLVKGAGIVTLGFALLLNGHQLFVALLIEALVLMLLNLKNPHLLKKSASWAVGILSFLALSDVTFSSVHPVNWYFGVVGWLSLGGIHRWVEQSEDNRSPHLGGTLASLAALSFILAGIMPEWSSGDRALCLGFIGVLAGGLSFFETARRHVYDPLAIFALTGFFSLVSIFALPALEHRILIPAIVITLLSSLTPAFLWRITSDPGKKEFLHLATGAFLAILVGLIWLALETSTLSPSAQLIIILGIPILGTLTAKFSKLEAHGIVPFFFHLALVTGGPFESGDLVLGLVMVVGHLFLIKNDDRPGILSGTLFAIACGFWGMWILAMDHPAIPLSLSSTALLLIGKIYMRGIAPVCAIPFFVMGLGLAFLNQVPGELYLCLVAPLILHLGHTLKPGDKKFQAIALVSLLVLWFQITMDTEALPRAAVWASTGTAYLLIGLGAKSRCFRLVGLIILGASLGHLMLFELMKLDSLPRILSFLTLGFGLLGLGFVYNRWQDRLKQIL